MQGGQPAGYRRLGHRCKKVSLQVTEVWATGARSLAQKKNSLTSEEEVRGYLEAFGSSTAMH